MLTSGQKNQIDQLLADGWCVERPVPVNAKHSHYLVEMASHDGSRSEKFLVEAEDAPVIVDTENTIYGWPKEEPTGYHVRKIEKGTIGEFSKIQEEFWELTDAIEQGQKVVELVELADLVGAIGHYVEKRYGITLDDLVKTAKLTRQVFERGGRK